MLFCILNLTSKKINFSLKKNYNFPPQNRIAYRCFFMKIKITILLFMFFQLQLGAELLINEAVFDSESDWVELFLYSEKERQIDVSNLFVTMYYGTNECLGDEPISIFSYDRPETRYDDRYILVHLSEPGLPDETDRTGDTNNNGVLDVYCNNYYGSLWGTDCVVAIDTDDDPSNGGIIDFIAYSNRDGGLNPTIEKYIINAESFGQWETIHGKDRLESTIDIRGAHRMSISRIKGRDTNSSGDFTLTPFITPGKENLTSIENHRGKIFKIDKRRISINGRSNREDTGLIKIFIFEECSIKLRVFSMNGFRVYESHLIKTASPGNLSLRWQNWKQNPTGLYIAKIEGVSTSLKKLETEFVYIILSKR